MCVAQTGELAEVVQSASRDHGIQRSTRRVTGRGLVGGAPSSQQSEARPGEEGEQALNGTTASEQLQGEGSAEERDAPTANGTGVQEQQKGDDQGDAAASDPQGNGGSASVGSGAADHASGKPESVEHLVEALKGARVNDPDPPAAQI